MCCLAKEHAENMETPYSSAGVLICVKFNKRYVVCPCSTSCINGQWSMSCVHLCLSHDSYLIRFVANYAIMHARSQSFLGHNVLFCAHRYNIYVSIRFCNSVIDLFRLII